MASASSSSPSGKTVNLLDLAAASVACTVSASRTIQHIARPHQEGEGNAADKKNTRTKDDGSFVTDADFVAQGIIIQALHSVSIDIRIVGEESEEEMERHMAENSNLPGLDDDILHRTRLELDLRRRGEQIPEESLPLSPVSAGSAASEASTATVDQPVDTMSEQEVVVDASRVSCIIDPLDGTRSYAKGEYDSVSILIAVVVDNKPCFGVIGKPFGYTDLPSILDTDCTTIYGGPLTNGVFVAGAHRIVPTPTKRGATEELPRAVISESRSKGVVHDFCVHLGEKGLVYPEPMLVSGAGEKSLRLILQKKNEGIWFYPKPGTSLWDVAAPDAILRSLGGRLSDKFGKEMDYSKSREEAENMEGVVACIDSDLHSECVRIFQEGDWLSRQ